MKIINVLSLLEESSRGDFKEVLSFNDAALGAVDIQGASPIWEMHPDTDELFYVIEGVLEIELLTENGSEIYSVRTNETCVVAKGLWHKLNALDGVKFMYLTPGKSLHSDQADPRVRD